MFVGHLSAANRGHSPPLSSRQVDLPPSPAHHATGAYLRIAANRNVSRINAAAAASHGAPVVHDLHQLLAAPATATRATAAIMHLGTICGRHPSRSAEAKVQPSGPPQHRRPTCSKYREPF